MKPGVSQSETIGISKASHNATKRAALSPASASALEALSRERKRDGAYAWGVFQDTADEERFLETFLLDSWLEHLRQHKRVTNADRVLQDHVRRFLKAKPAVTHLIAAESLSE